MVERFEHLFVCEEPIRSCYPCSVHAGHQSVDCAPSGLSVLSDAVARISQDGRSSDIWLTDFVYISLCIVKTDTDNPVNDGSQRDLL